MQRNNIGFHLGTVTYKRACAGGLLSLCFKREEPVLEKGYTFSLMSRYRELKENLKEIAVLVSDSVLFKIWSVHHQNYI